MALVVMLVVGAMAGAPGVVMAGAKELHAVDVGQCCQILVLGSKPAREVADARHACRICVHVCMWSGRIAALLVGRFWPSLLLNQCCRIRTLQILSKQQPKLL